LDDSELARAEDRAEREKARLLASDRDRARRLAEEQELKEREDAIRDQERDLEYRRQAFELEALRARPVPQVEQSKEEPPVRSRGPALLLQVGSVNWAGMRKALGAVAVLGTLTLSIITQLQKAEKSKLDTAAANTKAVTVQVQGDSQEPGLAKQVAELMAERQSQREARCRVDQFWQQFYAQQKPPILIEVVGCPKPPDSLTLQQEHPLPGKPQIVIRPSRPLPSLLPPAAQP
jgi:hypothetical protein